MKITGFRPLIVTKDQESIVKLFEELGFERRHRKTDIEAGANTAVAMKDANGNRISIASSETVPRCFPPKMISTHSLALGAVVGQLDRH